MQENFKTFENIQKFKIKYKNVMSTVESLAYNLKGKSIDEAEKEFKKNGFNRCTVRKDGMRGINPFFDPKQVYLYHDENKKFIRAHYL
jgi:hypothetical protein